jgi:hypothetical protein
MAEHAKIIDFPTRRATASGSLEGQVIPKVTYDEFEPEPAREANLDDLYSLDPDENRHLGKALAILDRLKRRLFEARKLMESGDLLSADSEITYVHSEIPELFLCASSSGGFGAVALAMYYALQAKRGQALNVVQVDAFQSCVSAMQSSPFMKFEDALPIVERLVSANLSVDPPEADDLSLLLAE